MKRLELSTLRLVLLIADSGSLTEAARRASLTLAAVSKRLLDLEAEMNLPLFNRTPKGIIPTEAGRALVLHARTVLFEVDRMKAHLSGFKQGQWGTVRIVANTTAMAQCLPDDLGRFLMTHPHIGLEVSELYSEEIVAALKDGRVDLGVFVGYVPHSGLESYPYRRDRLCIVTSLESHLAKKGSVCLNELLDMRFVVGMAPGSTILQLLKARSEGKLQVVVQTKSFDSVCRFVKAGIGIGVLPDAVAELYAPAMGLATVPLSDDWATRELYIGTRSRDALTVSATLLLDALTSPNSAEKLASPRHRDDNVKKTDMRSGVRTLV